MVRPFDPRWTSSFHPANNINGVSWPNDHAVGAERFFNLKNAKLRAVQEAYVDRVLTEFGGSATSSSTSATSTTARLTGRNIGCGAAKYVESIQGLGASRIHADFPVIEEHSPIANFRARDLIPTWVQ